MSLRLDLLVEGERRYQGAVSKPFMLKAVVGAVLGVLLVSSGLMYQQHASVSRELEQLTADWGRVESRVKSIEQKRANLARWQALKAEIDAWAKTRVEWADRLEELHGVVPDSAQLTRLTVKGDWQFIKPAAPAAPAPVEGEATQAPSAKPGPAVPTRMIVLSIAGKAAGDVGADAVRDMSNALRGLAGFRDLFESIKLQRLVRESVQTGNNADPADRAFDIDCQSFPRKLE